MPTTSCPHCSSSREVTGDQIGMFITCSDCEHPFKVPELFLDQGDAPPIIHAVDSQTATATAPPKVSTRRRAHVDGGSATTAQRNSALPVIVTILCSVIAIGLVATLVVWQMMG